MRTEYVKLGMALLTRGNVDEAHKVATLVTVRLWLWLWRAPPRPCYNLLEVFSLTVTLWFYPSATC